MATIKDGKGTVCLAAFDESLELKKHELGRPSPGSTGVLIDIKYCGMCHSDVHTCNGDWFVGLYPIAPGHEIGGLVKEVGSEVTQFKVGDRVAVGCYVESCRECAECKEGLEQHCLKNSATYGSNWPAGGSFPECVGTFTNGGYSDKICVDEHFVFKVPDSIGLEYAGPLLCAGITTFSPLRRHVLGKPNQNVAVVGLGGLGHMAVKFAAAMGAQVTVLSRSMAKKEAALKLGAQRVIIHTDDEAMRASARTFDTIIDTVSAKHSMANILSTLKVGGTCVVVGGVNSFELTNFGLLFNRHSIEGSMVGGVPETEEMLTFCAKHNVIPDIRIIHANQASEFFLQLDKGGPAIRNVIDISTLSEL